VPFAAVFKIYQKFSDLTTTKYVIVMLRPYGGRVN